MRSFISRAATLLLALALLAGGVAAQSKKKKRTKAAKATTSKTTKTTPATTPVTTTNTGDPTPPLQLPEQGDGVRRITAAEARAALDNGTAIIIDVRNDVVYKSGHVKGAILIPSNEIAAHIKELPRDKMIITYCS